MAPDVCPATPQPAFSFTQGLIVGQLSVVLLVAAFIKFFIFGDTPSAEATAAQRAADRRLRTEAHQKALLQKQKQPNHTQAHDPGKLGADFAQQGPLGGAAAQQAAAANRRNKTSVLRRPPTLTIGSILNKTYYRVDSHQPESLDWFNVLIAQTIAQFRNDAQHDNAILTSLTKALNGTSRPDFIDEIRVTELSLGEDFPIFSNCRIIPVDEDGLGYATAGGGGGGIGGGGGGPGGSNATRLQARMDVDLSDMITLAVETKLLLNYPRRLSAVLPVALAVSVVRFSGTLSVSFVPSNPSQATPTKMIFAFLDDYRLDFSIRSLLGSRSRLQDVPKIAQLVESRLHRWFDDRAVEPRFQEIALPSLWPRMKNARGGSGGSGAGATGSGGGGTASTASGASGTGHVGDDGQTDAAAAAAAAGVGAAATATPPPSMPPPTATDRVLNKTKSAGLDVLRRPESRDSRDSRETRDPRKEAETESWVERQQPPPLQAFQTLQSAHGLHAQPGQVPQLSHLMRSSQDTLRYRQRARHDEAFSRPGSIPDVVAEPHG